MSCGIKKFTSLCFCEVHSEMGLSLSRSLEPTKRQSDPYQNFELCLKLVSMFRMYSIQHLSANMSYRCGIVFLGVILQVSITCLELVNQCLDRFFVGVILLVDGRMGQSSGPIVNFAATSLPVLSTATSSPVLARIVGGRSRVRASSILASTMQIWFQYNPLR